MVALKREHDLTNAVALRSVLEALVADRPILLVDVTEAQFIDSTVINTLINADGRARAVDHRFILVAGTASIVATVVASASSSTIRSARNRSRKISYVVEKQLVARFRTSRSVPYVARDLASTTADVIEANRWPLMLTFPTEDVDLGGVRRAVGDWLDVRGYPPQRAMRWCWRPMRRLRMPWSTARLILQCVFAVGSTTATSRSR